MIIKEQYHLPPVPSSANTIYRLMIVYNELRFRALQGDPYARDRIDDIIERLKAEIGTNQS